MRARDIIEYCRLMLDDPHGDVHDDEAMRKHLNTVCRDISTRSRCLVGESYMPAVSGQARYGLPEDFLRLEYAGWQTGGGKYRPLSPTTFDIASWAAFNAKTGTPCYYDIFGQAAVERIVSVVEESSVLSSAVARAVADVKKSGDADADADAVARAADVALAQDVFRRYNSGQQGWQNRVVNEGLARILEAFKLPALQEVLNPAAIEFMFISSPGSLFATLNFVGVDLDDAIGKDVVAEHQGLASFKELLTTEKDTVAGQVLHSMILDPQMQELMQNPAAIGFLLALLQVGQLKARVVFLQPYEDDTDLTLAQRNEITTAVLGARDFFSQQMVLNGYAAQTFEVELDDQGLVPVETVETQIGTQEIGDTDIFNLLADTPGEIDMYREATIQIGFSPVGTITIAFTNITEDPHEACGVAAQGLIRFPALIYAGCWRWWHVAHEMGHLLGLEHPLDENGQVAQTEYIMSYGASPDKLLPANAAYLNRNQSFLLVPNPSSRTDAVEPDVQQTRGDEVILGPPPAVVPPPIDVESQWVRLKGEHIEDIKRGDRIVNMSDGSATGRVIEARNVLNAENEVEQIILYTDIKDGTRTFLQAGDEIRILSPGAPRQSLIVSPVPIDVGQVGEEALVLFIARTHREITARDIHEENDHIELDREFEPVLREYILYYMMRVDSTYNAGDAQQQLVIANSLYAQALPLVEDRIRQWKRTWTRGPGRYVNPLGDWKGRVTARYPIGSGLQTY